MGFPEKKICCINSHVSDARKGSLSLPLAHSLLAGRMPDSQDHHAFLNLCEMSIDNMYELEALGKMLEQKGLLTKQEIITHARDFKQQTPPIDPTDLTQQCFTQAENVIIEEPMAANLRHDLSCDHAKALLGQTI